jgi:hypothetical protein
MSTWKLLREVATKRWGAFGKSDQSNRIDRGLPLNIHLGSKLLFTLADVVLADGKLLFREPSGPAYVSAFGKFSVLDVEVTRFYMLDDKRLYCLQVALDKQNDIDDIKLFCEHDEVFPADSVEWDFWLNEHQGQIGWAAFQTKTGEQFGRAWNPEGDHTDPLCYREWVEANPDGTARHFIQHTSMLYGRNVTDATDEYVLITCAEEQNKSSVQIMVGLAINPNEINIEF